jgi:peptide/nickel transport system substrate-binding protein
MFDERGYTAMSRFLDDVEQVRADVMAGRMSRRDVLRRGVALGLSAPVIAGLLAACGSDDDDDDDNTDAPTSTTGAAVATNTTAASGGGEATATTGGGGSAASPTTSGGAEPTETTAPATEAGGGGLLRLLWWQAPTIINPHLATGTKDFDASRVCLEPLADFDVDGNGIPFLAAEMPSLENGGVNEQGTQVTWKLREGVKWHDGEDFNADDVVFTWRYASDEATAAVTQGNFANVESVEAVDDYTVTITFNQPNPAWFDVFTGPNGMILPEHILKDSIGAGARDAPFNLKPIGTGPFMVSEFRAGDVVMYDRFPDYWDAGKPYFDSVEMKGGGDAPGAARAVVVTGEGDWAWNIQVEPEILKQMEGEGGPGATQTTQGASAERMMINFADPNMEVDGARSEPSTQHPLFQHKEAREAISLAIRRDVIADQLYGPGGQATSNVLNAPAKFISPNTTWEFNLDKAGELLANVPDADGYSLLYQTSVNSVRQKTQEIIKQDLEELGFSVELKSVDSAVFFSSDAGNPDTYPHFYSDLEMYTNGPSSPYPISWAERFRTDEIASQANQWAGTNITRYNNPEFDKLHDQARVELDPDTQVELFVAMNDMAVNDFAEIGIVWRNGVTCVANNLTGYVGTTWASDVYDIKNWRRDE